MNKIKKLLLSFLCASMCIAILQPLQIHAIDETVEWYDEESSITPEAQLLNEDVENRTESSKDFIMSDKSKQTVIYSIPIHYEENGEWKEIDNTFIDDGKDELALIANEESDEVIGYQTSKSKVKIKFSKKMHKKNLASISFDDYKITWGMSDFDNKSQVTIQDEDSQHDEKMKVLDKITQTVLYEDIIENVSLRYSIDSLKIKEDIVLKERQNRNEFVFNYKTKNLSLILLETGEIEARDSKNNDLIFIMPKPYMVDSNNVSSNQVTYELINDKNGEYTIKVIADKEWINSEERVYPITIDPVIKTETSQSAIDTTFVSSWLSTTNFSTKLELLVGTETSEYGYCRTLVKFDLPSLNKGDMIVDAQLSIASYNHDFFSSSTNDMAVNAHMNTSSWNISSVTWNNKPSFESTVLDYDFISRDDINGTTNWKYFDITSAVKRWYDGTDNNGILLKGKTESTDYAKYGVKGYFWPERYNSTTKAYPYIILTYRNNKGLENYWDYSTASSNSSDILAVNNYSGNLVITHEDTSTFGRFPITVSHIYNGYMSGNNVANIKPYVGKGWKLNIQQTLLPSSLYGLTGANATNFPYVYMDEDGTEHYFKNTNDGLVDEDGLGLELTVNTNSYVIEDKDNNTMTFNASGLLTEIEDKYGSKITIFYNGTTITDLVDAVGNPIVLETNSDGYLASIEDQAGRTTSFTYTNGNLIKITGKNSSKTSLYTYDEDSSITQIESNDGSSLELSYTSLASGKRISKIVEKGTDGSKGQTVKYDRSEYNITQITTSGIDNVVDSNDDITTRLEFDNTGRLRTRYASTSQKELGVNSIEFTAGQSDDTNSEIKKLNRITKLAGLSPTVINYLINHSGESNNSWNHSQSIGTATFTFTSTTEEALFGTKSFKLNTTSSSVLGRSQFSQDITTAYIKPNTTYTASAYIKTKNVLEVSGQSSGGAAIVVYVNAPSMPTNSDPEAADYVSEYIVGTTDEIINDGWRRVSVTFTTPSDVSYVRFNGVIRGATGTAYFDGLQLEEGTSANTYNMLENSSFERITDTFPDFWTKVNLDETDKTSTKEKNGSASLRLASSTKKKAADQTISIIGEESDTYVVGGWVYGKGVPEKSSSIKYKVSVKITYSDGSTKWQTPAEINYTVEGWKYFASSFTLGDGTSANKIPISITVRLISYGQPNHVYYDDIQLYKKDVAVYRYDDNGNLIKDDKIEYTYDADNKVLTSTDGIDTTFNYTYDTNGNVTSTTNDINSVSEKYTYDSYGNQLSSAIQINGLKILTENIYDSSGSNIIESKDTDDISTFYGYSSSTGLLLSQIDGNGIKVNYSYDSSDRLVSISKHLSTNSISYDSNNNLSTLATDTTNYNYTYDVFGNNISSKIGNTIYSTNTYNANNGDLSTVTLGNNESYNYTYDEFGNLLELKENGTLIQKNQYNAEGILIYTIDYKENKKTQYDYDLSGNIIRIDVFDTNVTHLNDKWLYGIEYGYDDFDRIIKKNTKVGTEVRSNTYTYKDGSYIETYYIDNLKKFDYGYDNLNRLTSKTVNTANPISISYTYAASLRGNGYTTNKIATEKIGDITYTYTYDELGNITSITDSNGYKVSYIYDENSMLIEENNQFTYETIFYHYDNGGNIISKSVYPYTTGALSSYISWNLYSYDNENWKDQLTSINEESIIYDEIGNPTTYRDYTFTWKGRQLVSLVDFFEDVSSYTYGGNGERTSKTIDGQTTKYEYLNGVLFKETGPNGTLVFTYDNSGSLAKITHTKNNTTTDYYVLTNSRGDVEQIYNSNGILQCRYIYDSWGRTYDIVDSNYNSITNSNNIGKINPIRYRGYYYDGETGFYYLNSRYYDPQVGRFINADDISIVSLDPTSLYDKNLYSYCDNNPIVRKDSTGAVWETVFDVGSLAASVVEVAVNPTDVWAWAGLVGDAIDLVPFITGVGETIKTVDKLSDIDDVVDTAKSLKKTVSKAVGVYEIEYSSGINYVGKGPFSRAIQSAIEHTSPSDLNNNLGDTVVSIRWKQSGNPISAFMEEFGLQTRRLVNNSSTYNKYWSPGKRYYTIRYGGR